jgi:hypothetical protein
MGETTSINVIARIGKSSTSMARVAIHAMETDQEIPDIH